MFQTHPLDLHEIRSRIANSLDLKDLASCTRVSQEWNDSFTPPLYNSVKLSKRGPSMETMERNKHLIQHLDIQSRANETLSSISDRDEVISTVITNSVLITLKLRENTIGKSGLEALSDALKTNLTLNSLKLWGDPIGPNGAQALSEALKTNLTLTTLELYKTSIRDYGAQALSEALKTNTALTTLNLKNNAIGDYGAQALSEALKINSTLTDLDLG
ncbi:hypothetical protein BGZ91_010977, partial [Linnemannia elongata]